MSAADEKPKGFTVTDASTPDRGRLPPVDFPTFVLSLGSSALLHLGEGGPPGAAADAEKKDLELAKHSIDILSMLQEKTRGNLTAAESQLLENVLFDLRLRYVEAAKSQ